AAAADAHPARPSVRERAVDLVLHVIEPVEHDPIARTGHLVVLEPALGLLLRTIPRDAKRNVSAHLSFPGLPLLEVRRPRHRPAPPAASGSPSREGTGRGTSRPAGARPASARGTGRRLDPENPCVDARRATPAAAGPMRRSSRRCRA